jgi:hypothetical protein
MFIFMNRVHSSPTGLNPATRQGMKNQAQCKPTLAKFQVLQQLCNLIPNQSKLLVVVSRIVGEST